jgi:anhydro-N-acetylmuramic acid kinase
MSGTSMDAIDAALVEFTDEDLNLIHYHQFPYPRDIQSAVRSVNSDVSMREITRLDVILGELFAASVLELLKQCKVSPGDISAIGSHGQTVLHLPQEDQPRTLQIGDPWIIANRTGIPTVADFRRNDIAAGGQGAPLTPAFHTWKFRSGDMDRVVLNLGGVANITILPADRNTGVSWFDTGPCNGLMDAWTQLRLNKDYDVDGIWAREGHCNDKLLGIMLDTPYFSLPPPKSTGKDEFNLRWLDQKLNILTDPVPDSEVQATLLEFSARSISEAINCYACRTGEVVLCGGGIHNPALVNRLKELLPGMDMVSTEKYGVNPDAVEAITFAWLAKRRLENIPGNLPSVTGAKKAVLLGTVYAV